MSKDNSLKNWQLQEAGRASDQWQLQETEKALRYMQLQEVAGGITPEGWQPVEYQRQARQGASWVLPSLAIVAVLAVGGYVGWLGLSRMSGAPAAASTATAQPAAGAGAAITETVTAPTPTIEPTMTPTPASPTPTLEPTPIPSPALVERVSGTVNTDAGVNARKSPSTDGELIRLVVKDETMLVVDDQGDWLQVILPDNTVAFVSSEFVSKTTDLTSLDELNAARTAAGLESIAPIPPVAPSAIVASLPVTVVADPNAIVRVEPLAESAVIMTFEKGTQLVATQRSPDGKWIKVELENDQAGWMIAGFLEAGDGDLAALFDGTTVATVAPEVVAPNTESPTATLPLTSTEVLTGTTAETPSLEITPADPPLGLTISLIVPTAPFTNVAPISGPALSITATGGANARQTPGIDGAVIGVIPEGAVLPVVGRNADTTWLVVSLPDEQLAWVSREVVSMSDNGVNAPVLDDGALTGEATPVAANSLEVTGTTESGGGPIVAPAGGPVATVSTLLGANTRATPDQNADALGQVDRGDSFTAVGRTAASDWVQIKLPDGSLAWLRATVVELDVDIAELPTVP